MEKKNWVSCGKAIAMAAVITDHMCHVLYENGAIAYLSFFSVTLFILLSGVTSYYSNKKHANERGLKETFRRIGTIFIPYAVATAVYLIYDFRAFYLETYLHYLFAFNLSGPFYFVAFYIQLVIISPFLYDVIIISGRYRFSVLINGLVIAVLFFISFLSIHYSNMIDTIGGAKYLFGGTYLPVYYLGMLIGSKELSLGTKKRHASYMCASIIQLVLWMRFLYVNSFKIDRLLPFGNGVNPPSITLIVYGLLWFFGIFSTVTFLNAYVKSKFIHKMIALISEVGNSSLDIFLYHYLIYRIMSQFPVFGSNLWIKRIVYLSAMIFIPMAVRNIFKKAKGFIQQRKTCAY